MSGMIDADKIRLEIMKEAEKKRDKKIEDWSDLYIIDKFVIFEGSEKIYDIHKYGKKIRLEGKEILDYNIFRLRLFEELGILLPTERGIGQLWAGIVNNWYAHYKEISTEKCEDISENEEAKQLIINYINNCSVSESYLVKEGIITFRENFFYVPTKIIKKLLKREGITISMRKLAYVLDEFLASGSIPYKIENKSERFWKLYAGKFETNLSNKIEVDENE